jgi:acetoacetate decarboxylase
MFKFSENTNYLMPAHFGGSEGQPKSCTYDDVTSIMVCYETDLEMLSRYIPEGFEVTHPVIAIDYEMNRGVDWMAGGSYNLICVQAPVMYIGAREPIEGWYALVVWENKTCPILGGREQTGMPKIFADIEDHHRLGDKMFTNASYEGSAFLRMEFQKTRKMTAEELAVKNRQQGKTNWFGWRYIPNIGRPGAALSHATLYPLESVFMEGWLGDGRIHWEALTWEQHPNQAHIINALGKLPIKAYLDCQMVLKKQNLRIDFARQLP